MQPTQLGMNRTGAATSQEGTQAMIDANAELAPPGPVDLHAAQAMRMAYIEEAPALGSVPAPSTFKGVVKAGMAKLSGGSPTILMDKLSERIAFERGGTRLYDGILTKYRALVGMGEALPDASEALALHDPLADATGAEDEDAMQTLERFRAEELEHFHLLVDAMERMGGDPTAQTPCADAVATSAMGLIQVISDPRTTLAQSLNALLTAELTDNAGWELLAQLAEEAGQDELAGQFLGALGQEQQHLAVVKAWLTLLACEKVGSTAV